MNKEKKRQNKVIKLIQAVNRADITDMALFGAIIRIKYGIDERFKFFENEFYKELTKNENAVALIRHTK